MFASWSERYGFRRRLTLLGMVLGLVGTPALSIALDEAIPALPLIAAGYLLPNLDRIAALLRGEADRRHGLVVNAARCRVVAPTTLQLLVAIVAGRYGRIAQVEPAVVTLPLRSSWTTMTVGSRRRRSDRHDACSAAWTRCIRLRRH